MGLLLRPDVYYTRSDDGLYMLTHEGPVFFGGRSVHPLLVKLAPYLNGCHSLAELTENLSGERREMVRKLLTALMAKGTIKQIPEANGFAPDDAGQRIDHRDEVSFLGYFHDSGCRTFRDYRAEKTVVIGK